MKHDSSSHFTQGASHSPEIHVAMRKKIIGTQRNIQRRTAKVLGKVPPRHDFKKELLRLREIEKLIRHRYGHILPEIDSDGVFHGDAYLRAVAAAIHASGSKDVLSDVQAWCRYIAPFLFQSDYADAMAKAVSSVQHRVFDLRGDVVGRLLDITLAERLSLGLKTVGVCDCSPAELRKIMKDRKMVADRERIAKKRKAEGRKPRAAWEAESLARQKPWEAEGISRRTWYRRRGTSVSRIEESKNEICDTPVPTFAIELQPRQRQSLKKGEAFPFMQRAIPRPRREAKRSRAVGPSPKASALMPYIYAIFDAVHADCKRRKGITGTATQQWQRIRLN